MTDQLGQSQVIPYIIKLTEKGHIITILSFEKNLAFKNGEKEIRRLLESGNINWKPKIYTKNPPVLSTIIDIVKMQKAASKLHKENKFDIIHCRSYIAAFSGLKLKRRFGTKFLFDIRGFWPEERVDGKIWNLKNPLYRIIFNYFKQKEKVFFREADAVVSLTQNGLDNIIGRFAINETKSMTVIPCCTDLNHFNYKTKIRSNYRESLSIPEDSIVLLYLGALGTWYMLDEMLDFFKTLYSKNSKAVFLFVTKEDPVDIIAKSKEKGLPENSLRITKSDRNRLPGILAVADIAIFFIKPVFSKKASSPTKLAELLAMGIPVIANSGVGDLDYFYSKHELGFLINRFSEEDYLKAIEKLETILNIPKDKLRFVAEEYFSLEKGSELYHSVYVNLSKT